MIKILFVCHGNICRSPMAEFIMKNIVKNHRMENSFEIASAATSSEELGNPVYPPARRKLMENGISCDGKTARKMTVNDYHYYDMIILMDYNNMKNAKRIIGNDTEQKLHMLMDYTLFQILGTHVILTEHTTTYSKAVRGCSIHLSISNTKRADG